MKTIITLLTLLLTLLPVNAKTKKIDADPVNVAFLLSQETDSAAIASTLAYYGYALIPDTERSSDTAPANTSYSTYRHSNGNIIRFSFRDTTSSRPYPAVEVKAVRNRQDLNETLSDLKFKKQDSFYIYKVGQHAKTETICRHLPGGFLSFQRSKIKD